jgi:nicotinamidase-related amidase
MRSTHLLIIDPQNDFCDIAGAALPVPGADADLQRLAGFIASHAGALASITVTLDSHATVAVERTTFWLTGAGEAVAPFTFITADQVRAGAFTPRDASLTPAVLSMLDQLAAAGRPGLVVWPVHCVTGTWGHNIHGALAESLAGWELLHQRAVRKVLKGEYPLTEHFGVFEADAPDAAVPSTLFNTALATQVSAEGVDLLLIAGQASSHCVAASYRQLAGYLKDKPPKSFKPRIVILSDAMSPVPGFEPLAEAFFEQARADGAELMGIEQAAVLLA